MCTVGHPTGPAEWPRKLPTGSTVRQDQIKVLTFLLTLGDCLLPLSHNFPYMEKADNIFVFF